ncbi:hypothetical protein [Bacillus sp. M6-12]|uniref:hypothetical protein n=1 Tax=Bacillus sp. M6-12 TaxID=2054166 RepID=UPI0015E0B5FC|nr:hypothetical protein [Bacillus sp. M6-12]
MNTAKVVAATGDNESCWILRQQKAVKAFGDNTRFSLRDNSHGNLFGILEALFYESTV